MKHTLKITIILISLFLLTQVVGLATINKYIKVEKTKEGLVIKHEETIIGPQPEIKEKSYSAIPITIAILIGTALVLLLIRFRLGHFWKLWFFIAVFLTLAVSFNVYIARIYAVILALILAAIKTFKPNIIVHNFTEIFVYTGITIIILPYLNIISAFTLLILISIYDMYAVWKSKHMIKLAKFQTKSKVFAGLFLRYKPKIDSKKSKGFFVSLKNFRFQREKKKPKTKKLKIMVKQKSAILGGGDIAFPLMFSAAVMEHLVLKGITKQMAFIQTSIITLFVCIALAILFIKSKKNKFYPAMPFLALGCILGYVVVLAINSLF